MKRLAIILAVAAIFASCHKGGVKLGTDTDSLAYVIGMNVGHSLMQMDSTLNVEVVCAAIKDVIAETEELVPAGVGDGNIPKLVEMIQGDQVLTLEPHLVLFATLQSLEVVDATEVISENKAKDGAEGYAMQYNALCDVLKAI